MERKIVWNKRPSKFLARALKIISDDSLVQAERIEEELILTIQSIITHPEKYPPDKFKKNNPGNFRAFEKPPFRIAYSVTETKFVFYGYDMLSKNQKDISYTRFS